MNRRRSGRTRWALSGLAALLVTGLAVEIYFGVASRPTSSRSQPPRTTRGPARPSGPGASPPPAQVTVTAAVGGPERSIPGYFLGFNGENLREQSQAWLDPRFAGAVAGLGPESVRVFGGGTANFWDWRTGTFLASHGNDIVAGGPHPPIPFSAFVNVVKSSGATPVYDLNMVSSNLADQLAMLHQALAAGLPVSLVELGNELYVNNPQYDAAFPTAQDYGRTATQWIAAIKVAFPGVRVAAVGSVANPTGRRRPAVWNRDMLQTLHGEDALTFHTYWPSRVPAGSSVATPSAAAASLASPAQQLLDLQHYGLAALPAGVGAWVTEWNLKPDPRSHLASTWLQGLEVAAYAIGLLDQPQVQLADNHALVGDNLFSAIFAGTHEQGAGTTTALGLSAGGRSLGALLTAMRGMSKAQQLTLAGAPVLPGGVPAVLGQMFSAGARQSAVVLNLSNSSVALTLPPQLRGMPVAQLADSPAAFVSGAPQSGLTSVETPASAGTITLAPYSMTRLG